MSILKGDIYFANLYPTFGSEQGRYRPVVIVQNDYGNKYSPTTIIAPITNKLNNKNKLPTHVRVSEFEGLKYDSLVLLEQIRVIDKRRLKSFVTHLSSYKIKQINFAMIVSLGIKNWEEIND